MRMCQDIAEGMHSDAAYQLEPDRKLAIKLAIASAQSGDVILLAGKGHEKVQIFAGVHHPYDERAFVRQLMSELLA
jgi:UDP-N-acetylmuramoyl-L-alanyl-D-glutamate--2,6-diaminopimelate ligase